MAERLPLDGIRIIDLSRILSGPFATMRLADLGAEVIKVEMPGTGDDARAWGPPFAGDDSVYFLTVNRGKQSLAVDLKRAEGREVLEKLIATGDVLFENFRTGTLERLGFGWDRLHAAYPGLVYASVSGYGQTGSRATDPAYDLVIQGESGLMTLTGDPAGDPQKCGTSIADIVAGLHAVQGILAALLQRTRTGTGARVDISLFDGLLSTLTYQSGKTLHDGKAPSRMGNQHPTIAPYETYDTSDGHLNVCVGNEGHWRRLVELLGDPGLSDASFASNAGRVTNRQALNAILAPAFGARPTAHWVETLSAAQIPAGPIRGLAEALADPVVVERQMIVHNGPVRALGNPVQIDGPCLATRPPPRLGEHSQSILQSLGYDEAHIAQLRDEQVI